MNPLAHFYVRDYQMDCCSGLHEVAQGWAE
jgi:hypothetical protein